MRLDRILRGGPWRGGLMQRLDHFFQLCPPQVQTFPSIPEGEAAIKASDPVWQRFSNGRTMSADGLTLKARAFFTILLARGAEPEMAANFIKSMKKQYSTVTMPPLKFDRLLRAQKCFMDSIGEYSLAEAVSNEMSTMADSIITSSIYLEVASRAMLKRNSDILNHYYDEVEVVNLSRGDSLPIPMRRPYISTSKFLLVRKVSDDALDIFHCPSSRVLSLMIDEDSKSVEAVIQPARSYAVFRSEEERERWVYKQVLSATLGFANALWLRRDGELHNIFKKTLLLDPAKYVRSVETSRGGDVSPIASRLTEEDWLRLGSSSRVSHIGATVCQGRWEFEVVSINGIADLPPVPSAITWRFHAQSAHEGSVIRSFEFVSLPYDSESVRRIAVNRGRQEFATLEDQTEPNVPDKDISSTLPPVVGETSPQAAKTAQADAAPAKEVTTSGFDYPVLSAQERILAASAEGFLLRFKPELIEAGKAVIRNKGPLLAPQTAATYIAEVYALAHIDDFLEAKSPEWREILNDDQRQAMRRLIGRWLADEYIRMFPQPTNSSTEGAIDE